MHVGNNVSPRGRKVEGIFGVLEGVWGQRTGGASSKVVTYSDGGANIVQVIHTKHLLVRVLDDIENWGWSLINWFATVQPLPSGIREAEPGEIPETGRLVVWIAGSRLEPTGSLCV